MKIIKLLIILTLFFFAVSISSLYSQEYTAVAKNACGSVDTSIITCPTEEGEGIEGSTVWALLVIVIKVMTGGVVITAVGGMIYGSILFTASGSNPENRKKSMTIFTNIGIGVVAYALMWALLSFIIPGGIKL